MEQLIELFAQIQELAGVGIEAIQQATGGGGGEAPPAEGGEAPPPPPEG